MFTATRQARLVRVLGIALVGFGLAAADAFAQTAYEFEIDIASSALLVTTTLESDLGDDSDWDSSPLAGTIDATLTPGAGTVSRFISPAWTRN